MILRRAFKYFGGDLSGYFKERRLQGTFKELTERYLKVTGGLRGGVP